MPVPGRWPGSRAAARPAAALRAASTRGSPSGCFPWCAAGSIPFPRIRRACAGRCYWAKAIARRPMRSAGLCVALVCRSCWGLGRRSSAAHNPWTLITWLGMVPGPHDWRPTAMVTLFSLVSGLDAELVRLGYKGSTMVGIGAAGAAWRSSSLPAAWKSSHGIWPWCGSTKPAAFSARSRPARSSRPMSTCSGSPRCPAITRSTGRCCAATPAPLAGWLGTGRTPSPGSRCGCGPPAVPCRPCGRMRRWLGSSSRSWILAAGRLVVTRGRSRRSFPRWRDTSSRPSSRNCAPCGPSSGSRPAMDWSAPPYWTRSRL